MFIINLIPLHVFVLLIMGRFSQRLFVSYSVFYIVGLLMSMQIPFVGFQPIRTSEHMAASGETNFFLHTDNKQGPNVSYNWWTWDRLIVACLLALTCLWNFIKTKLKSCWKATFDLHVKNAFICYYYFKIGLDSGKLDKSVEFLLFSVSY